MGPAPVTSERGSACPFAHDQAMPVFVDLVDQARDVAVDLGLEGSGQHPPRPLGHQLVQRRSTAPRSRAPQHVLSTSAFLPAGVSPPANLFCVKQEGTPRLRSGGASTGFGYISVQRCVPTLARSQAGQTKRQQWLRLKLSELVSLRPYIHLYPCRFHASIKRPICERTARIPSCIPAICVASPTRWTSHVSRLERVQRHGQRAGYAPRMNRPVELPMET